MAAALPHVYDPRDGIQFAFDVPVLVHGYPGPLQVVKDGVVLDILREGQETQWGEEVGGPTLKLIFSKVMAAAGRQLDRITAAMPLNGLVVKFLATRAEDGSYSVRITPEGSIVTVFIKDQFSLKGHAREDGGYLFKGFTGITLEPGDEALREEVEGDWLVALFRRLAERLCEPSAEESLEVTRSDGTPLQPGDVVREPGVSQRLLRPREGVEIRVRVVPKV